MGNKREDMGIGTGREESTKQKRRQEPGWMRKGNGEMWVGTGRKGEGTGTIRGETGRAGGRGREKDRRSERKRQG